MYLHSEQTRCTRNNMSILAAIQAFTLDLAFPPAFFFSPPAFFPFVAPPFPAACAVAFPPFPPEEASFFLRLFSCFLPNPSEWRACERGEERSALGK